MNVEQTKLILGLKIKSFRVEQKYTQEDLSSILGLEQSNLSKIETGKSFPDITTLCTLINKTKVEPNYLLDFLREDNSKYTSLDFEILNHIINLPREAKENLKKFLINL